MKLQMKVWGSGIEMLLRTRLENQKIFTEVGETMIAEGLHSELETRCEVFMY